MTARYEEVEVRHAHLFCGLGGGARGFNAGEARVGRLVARFRCLGGIDVDAASIRDFQRLAGVPGTVLDLFARDQFTAFHGREPPASWREATPRDIQAAFGFERPHIVFLSAPCKGFSGLLAESTSASAKYQALNALTLRGVWLALEAYADDPPELFIFENVPRIATRGRVLLDRIGALFAHYGYAVAETTHDCGELGGLGQSRKRFLLVARHQAKVPPYLYEPPKRSLRGVGEILDRLPCPGDLDAGGPMHRIPSLQWKTWVRLAFVEAGADWRSLNRLRVENGQLLDYGIEADTTWHSDVLGVRSWDQPTGAVTSRSGPTNGAFAVADPRLDGARYNNAYRIVRFTNASPAITSAGGSLAAVADPRPSANPHTHQSKYRVSCLDEATGAVIGASTTGNGAFAVADPRTELGAGRNPDSRFGVKRWDQHSPTVTSQMLAGNGAHAVADPRATWGSESHRNKLRVTPFEAPASTVTGSGRVGSGALSVADPRPGKLSAPDRDAYLTGGHYGVVPWDDHARAVPGFAKNNNGPWSVADPRPPAMTDQLVCVIRALDGTWHRPFTTLELAALQSLFDPEDRFELDGASDAGWRERIGNAVPSSAAQAVASTMGTTLLLAWSGETFMLSAQPIWVRPMAIALAVDGSAMALASRMAA